MKKTLFGALVLLAVGVVLWQSGVVHEAVMRSEWAKEKIEKFAGRTLDSHLKTLGHLGYYKAGTSCNK